MYEDTFKYSNRNFYTDTDEYSKRPMKENVKSSANSVAVANCIRALTQKTGALTQENNELKQKNFLLMQELEEIRKNESDGTAYREKCFVLEHSNEIFQKKIGKLMETAENYEKLKAEMVLLNKELTREIEKNKKLILENNELKDKELDANNCESFGDVVRKSQKNGIYGDAWMVDRKGSNKVLEDLVDKLQTELENKRNVIEGLKEKIADLEDNCFDLKQDKRKLEIQMQEVEDMNGRLLRTMKKKSHVCKHRASTPDIAAIQSTAQSYENLRFRNVNN